MRLLFEVIISCLVNALLVKVAKGNNPLNCLYFYPKPVREKAYESGLADEQSVHKRSKCFYTGIPYVKTWKRVLVGRVLGTIAYIPIAAVFALIFSRLSIRIWNG